MKKYLYILILALSSIFGAGEDYYHDKPTIQHVFSAIIQPEIEWVQQTDYNRVCEAFDIIAPALEALYREMEIESVSYSPSRADGTPVMNFLLTKKNNRRQFQYCVLIHMEYKKRSHTLSTHNPAHHDSRFDEDEYCHTLSWRYTDQILHKLLQRYGQFGEQITRYIDRKGFFNSIIRLGIVVNADHTYNFYHAFTTDAEKAMALPLMHALKRHYERMNATIY